MQKYKTTGIDWLDRIEKRNRNELKFIFAFRIFVAITLVVNIIYFVSFYFF